MEHSQKGEIIMAALSLVTQFNTISTVHDELLPLGFLGERKLSLIEDFLDGLGIISLGDVTLTNCIEFNTFIAGNTSLSTTQKKTYSSALETAIRIFYENENKELLRECSELEFEYGVLNKLIFFLSINHIHHLSEITALLRQELISYLKDTGITQNQRIIRALDLLKLYSIEMDSYSFRKMELLYKNELMYLAFHPKYEIAKDYSYTQNKDVLVFDFSLDVSIVLKKQIFTLLKYFVEECSNRENHYRIQHFIQPLWNLYHFCIDSKVWDISKITAGEITAFNDYLLTISKNQIKTDRHIIGIVRKHLFLTSPQIDWDASAWFLERFNFSAGRVNEARPTEAFYFDDITTISNQKLMKAYMQYLIALSPRYSMQSVHIAYSDVRELLRYFDNHNIELITITVDQLDGFINDYYLRENMPQTVNKMLGSLSKFMDYLLAKNLIHPIIFPFERYRVQEVAHHTDLSVDDAYMDELLSALSDFPEHLRLMVLHLTEIGLRANEVCSVKGNAYSFDGEDAWFLIYQPKAKREKRVPMPYRLYEIMIAYIRKNGIDKDNYVFPALRVNGPYRVGTFTKQVRALLAKKDIAFRSHSFRHTLATDLFTDGASLQTIREYLGHASIDMTKQYVDHLPNAIDQKNKEYFNTKEKTLPWNNL